jgi:hypothetical protein
MPSLLDLLGKTSDAVLGTVPNVYSGLLSDDELRAAKSRAQSDALANMANAFYAAGEKGTGTGRALLQGLSAGRGGFDEALKGQVQEKMNQQKIQQALQGQKRAAEAQNLLGGAFQPAQPANVPMMNGMQAQGPVMPATPAQFNLESVAPQLMRTAEGRAALADVMGAQKAMRPEMFTLAEGATQFERDPMTGEVRQVGTSAPKSNLTSDYKNYQSAQAQGFKGSFMDYQTSLKKAGVEDKSFSRAIDLRKDFRSEPVYKAQQEMKSAYSQVKAGLDAQTPVGDLAAATKIMKLLDPGSVVRESELGMAMAATGLLDRVTNYAENIVKGTKLTEQQRKDFANLAQSLYGISESEYNKKREEYVGIAKRNNLPLEDVVGPAASLPKIQRIGW